MSLFKEQILRNLAENDLDLYLTLVGELAEESGRDMAEIAAAAARLARGDKPLTATVVSRTAQISPAEDGMIRLFIDAGRKSGIGPNDIVGAIAGEADIPGKSIGAIDIYDRFTFVEIPEQYKEQVLTAMAGVSIRNQPVNVSIAVPRGQALPDDADQGRKHVGGDRLSRYGQRLRQPGHHFRR